MKKLIALILAMVMILSLGTTVYALELGEKICLRNDLDAELITCTLAFEGVEGGLHLTKNNRGLYSNRYYDESLSAPFTITVDYQKEGEDIVRVVSDPMYLSDIDGIIVLDEEGFHVENSYLVEQFSENADYQKEITIYGTYEGGEEADLRIFGGGTGLRLVGRQAKRRFLQKPFGKGQPMERYPRLQRYGCR